MACVIHTLLPGLAWARVKGACLSIMSDKVESQFSEIQQLGIFDFSFLPFSLHTTGDKTPLGFCQAVFPAIYIISYSAWIHYTASYKTSERVFIMLQQYVTITKMYIRYCSRLWNCVDGAMQSLKTLFNEQEPMYTFIILMADCGMCSQIWVKCQHVTLTN